MDSLSTILSSVRLGSTAISCAHLGAPWSVRTEGAPAGIFHAMLEGSGWLVADGLGDPVYLDQGDVVVLPGGGPHTICDDLQTPPARIRDLRLTRGQNGVGTLHHGGKLSHIARPWV